MPSVALAVAHRVLGPPVRGLLRATVVDADHVPTTGGALLAANHLSNLDNYLLSAASPRPLRYVGKRELARGVFGAFNVAMGMVPVDRGRSDRAALDRLVAVVTGGEVLAIFPEGTRSPTGELFGFRSGVARLAHAAGAPVVPVGIRGTGDVWPRHGRPRPRPPARGRLQVRFGAPVAPPDSADPRTRRQWTATLRTRVAELGAQPLADRFAAIDETER